MYGGIEEPKEIKADTKIVPTGDIYSMKLSQSKSKPHTPPAPGPFNSNGPKRLARFIFKNLLTN